MTVTYRPGNTHHHDHGAPMTTSTTAPEDTQPTVPRSADGPTSPDLDAAAVDPTDERLSSETARWRKTAREAETDRDTARAERDTAREQLAKVQRSAVEHYVRNPRATDGGRIGEVLHDPADLLEIGGHDVATLLEDDGVTPSPERINAALDELRTRRSYLFRPLGGAIQEELMRGGGSTTRSRGSSSDWGKALSQNPTA